jgi:hypothetical protein
MNKINLGDCEKWDIEPDIINKCRIAGHKGKGYFHEESIETSHAKHKCWCDKCNFEFTFNCH